MLAYMKKLINLMLMAGMVAMGLVVSSCNKDNPKTPETPEQAKAKYTIMFYGCGGGDIDMQLEDALEGLVKELSVEKNQVRYTVMYSMSAGNKDFKDYYRGELGKTYRYELSKDTDLTKAGYRSKYFYKNASEVELYKASTIADFIKWSTETAPAENYIIEFVNHGGGFDLGTEVPTKGIAYDDNHKDQYGNGKGIAICTIADALKTAGVHMKAIYWNGCMMGQLEVLTEVAPYCDYQFSSSHVAFADNNHVVALVNAINAEPADFEKAALKHKELIIGKGVADVNSFLYSYQHSYDQKTNTFKQVNGDFGCWRSAKLAAIGDQVKKLGEFLVKAYKDESEKDNVDQATHLVYLYEMSYGYSDILDYAQKVAYYIEKADLKVEAQAIAADLKKALADANVYRINCENLKTANGVTITTGEGGFSLGISLYAGTDKDDWQYAYYSANYKASAFDKAYGWSKWMDINGVRVSSDEKHPNTTNPGNDSTWELFWLEVE